MFSNEDVEKLKKIASTYTNEQYVKLAEECSELEIASMRYRAGRDADTHNLTEEMADVAVMMYQIAFLSGIELKDIETIAHEKIKRTMKRMTYVPSESENVPRTEQLIEKLASKIVADDGEKEDSEAYVRTFQVEVESGKFFNVNVEMWPLKDRK